MSIRFSVVMAALMVSAFAASAFASEFGRTKGQFAVSPTGASIYQIPIWVPPGPRGIQPNLSIVYNSQAGNGTLGPGWQIGGLSAITRCNKTFAQDAVPAAITLTLSDRFCLDGQRLRLTSSETLSTYGEASTTYQTEVANFSNVTANGTAGSGPGYFTVQAKNGLTYEYGNVNTTGAPNNGSQVLAPGTSTALQWLLDKVSDRYGNNYVITYSAPNAAEGVGLPTTISYTPSSSGSTTYNYTVTFAYGTRVSQNPNTHKPAIVGVVAGSTISNPNLLKSITVASSGTTVREYTFGYTASATTTQALLTGVTECGGSAGTDCLQPTAITYQAGAAGVQTSGTTVATGTLVVYALRDFNGDGREDILYVNANTSELYVAFATASGFATPVAVGITTANAFSYGDMLGKGQTDILTAVSNVWWRYSWNGSAFVGASTGIELDTGVGGAWLIDINGDGLADLVTVTTGGLSPGQSTKIYARLNASTAGKLAFASTETLTTMPPCPAETSCYPYIEGDGGLATGLRSLDFNGDGMKDLALQISHQQTGHIVYYNYTLLSNGTSFNIVTGGGIDTYEPNIYFNANNDACTDIAQGSSLYIAACNGNTGSAIALAGTAVGAMDWDGDGLDDVLIANGTTVGVQESTGSGITALITTNVPYSSTYSTSLAYPFDQNGDGLADLAVVSSASGGNITYQLHNGANTPPDLLSKVTDGYGNSVSPTYVSIAESNYSQYTDATYPYRNYIGPLYVVGEAVFSDPSNMPSGTYNQQF